MKTALVALLCALPLLSTAQTVWRCGPEGRSFSDTPCAQGQAMDVAQAPRPQADLLSAQSRAANDKAQADRLTRERLASEAALRGNGLNNIGPLPKAAPLKTPVRQAAPKLKRHSAHPPADDGIWRAVVPRSRRGSG